jgi:putative membrane protein
MKLTLNKIICAAGISLATTMAYADDQMPLTGQLFVTEAGKAGLKEVYLGQVALQKSQDSDVKEFARHMVRDHTSANKKLMKIADAEGLYFPPTNLFSMSYTNSDEMNSNSTETVPFNSSAGPGTNNMKGAEELVLALQSTTNIEYIGVERLEATPEPEFDSAYANQAVQDHIAAVGLFEDATNLPDKDLRKFAEKTLPTLQKHLEMAEKLQSKFGGMANTNSAASAYPNSPSGMRMSGVPE